MLTTQDSRRYERLTTWAEQMLGERWPQRVGLPLEGAVAEEQWLHLESYYRMHVSLRPDDAADGLVPMPASVEAERRKRALDADPPDDPEFWLETS